MDLADSLKVIGVLVSVATLFVGIVLSIFVLYKFVPKLHLTVEYRNFDHAGAVVLQFTMENVSSVYARKEKVMMQILPYDRSDRSLSEWVPFSEDAIRSGEEPMEWAAPVEIFNSTTGLHAGEKLTVERLHMPHPKAKLLHVGFQYRANLAGLSSWVSGLFASNEQWTTTVYVPVSSEESS